MHSHILSLQAPRRMHHTCRRNVPHIRALIGHALGRLVIRTLIRTAFATFTLCFGLPPIILVPTQVRLRRPSALLGHLVRLGRLSVAMVLLLAQSFTKARDVAAFDRARVFTRALEDRFI